MSCKLWVLETGNECLALVSIAVVWLETEERSHLEWLLLVSVAGVVDFVDVVVADDAIARSRLACGDNHLSRLFAAGFKPSHAGFAVTPTKLVFTGAVSRRNMVSGLDALACWVIFFCGSDRVGLVSLWMAVT